MVASSSVQPQYLKLGQPFRGHVLLNGLTRFAKFVATNQSEDPALLCDLLNFPCILEDCFTSGLCQSPTPSIKRPSSVSYYRITPCVCAPHSALPPVSQVDLPLVGTGSHPFLLLKDFASWLSSLFPAALTFPCTSIQTFCSISQLSSPILLYPISPPFFFQ